MKMALRMQSRCILNSNPLKENEIMKRISIILTVFTAALLSSCTQEKSLNDKVVGNNDIVFSLQGAPATRSMEEMSLVQKGATIELAADENGQKLFLEETIEDLNRAWAPATKGTPAYTENVGVLYKNKLGVYAAAPLGDVNYESLDDEMYEGGWRYNHTYASDPWANGAVDFYFRMPSDMTSHGVTLGTDAYGKSGNNLTITFGYESPTEAKSQQDIIFAARNVNKDQYTKSLPNGVPVLFNHALTAVKFAIANPEEASITSIEFTGLVGKGTCTITPAKENDYRDNTGNYSSADAVNWTLDKTATGATYSSGEFGDPVSYDSGSFANNGDYPSSFAAAGAAQTNNLNDADATQTFWFIPQAMTDKVMLHITYTYGGNEGEGYIEFGKVLAEAGVIWKAGQLRTYTIRVDEVNLKIEDDVKGTGIVGMTKEDVVITNTGNVDVFIRAAIVGQWLDKNDNPVFGFTDEINDLFVVESWYEDQFVSHAGQHGVFENLAGYSNRTNNTSYSNPFPSNGTKGSWYYSSRDNYYYFSKAVAPGDPTGEPLFKSYTVSKIPEASNGAHPLDVEMYFTLEIATQAISARKSDGSLKTWTEAWKEALDYDPSANN